MRIFNGEENFESFYLKHFTSLQDLQNCTECFKNLSIYSGSIYYQVSQSNTGSFKRILTENDNWLNNNFWKNVGNNFGQSSSLGTLDNNSLNIITSGSTRLFVSSSGLIGINSINPTYTFDVNGTLRNTTSAYFATTSGNVGIGLLNPTSKLQISGSTYGSGTINTGTSFGAYNINEFVFNPAYGGTTPAIQVVNNAPLILATNNLERVRISSNGNVLVGTTTNTGELLQVNGTLKSNYFLTPNYLQSTGTNVLIFSNNGVQDIWSQGTNGIIRFVDSGYVNINFQISQNGNGYFRGGLGIGVTSPNAPLQFSNTLSNRKIVLWESANNDHYFYGFGINSGTLRYQTPSISENHVFYSAVSTSSSQQLFSINGNQTVTYTPLTTTQINNITGMLEGTSAWNSTIKRLVTYDGTGWKRPDGTSM